MTAAQKAVMAMDWTQIVRVWQEKQRANRTAGLPFYERLIDPTTDEVMARIDD